MQVAATSQDYSLSESIDLKILMSSLHVDIDTLCELASFHETFKLDLPGSMKYEVRVKSEFKSFTKATQWGLKQGEAQVPVFMVSDSQNIFYIQMYVMWPSSGSSEELLSNCHYA